MYASSRITENNIINTDLQTEGLLEKILDRDNMNKAYKKVKSNKGAGGINRMEVDELLQYLRENPGTYHPIYRRKTLFKGKQAENRNRLL